MTDRKHQRLATISLLITFLIWGASIPIIKITLSEVPAFTLAFMRFSIASLLIAPFFIFDNLHHPIDLKDVPRLIITALLGPALTNVLFYLGLQRTSAIDAGIIQALFPIVITIVGVLFLNETIRKLSIIGTLISTLGTLIIIGPPLLGLDIKEIFTASVGNGLIFSSVLTWTAYTIGSKGLFDKYNHMTMTAISFLTATVALFPFIIIEYLKQPNWPSGVTIVSVLGVANIIVFSSLFAYFFYEWSIKYLSAHKIAFLSHSQPLFTIISAYFLLGEPINLYVTIGALLIITGIFMATYHFPHHHIQKGHKL